MSLRDEICRAYDDVKAPDELTERIKRDLYQKDISDDAEQETFLVEEAPRPAVGRYLAFIAASVMLCAGFGYAAWRGMRDNVNELNPRSSVPIETAAVTEETTETTAPAE